MTLLLFLAGLALLILGAELMVRGASRLSLSLGIAPLVVGLTVVSFGTSAPELAISVKSALGGQADLALGNVVGSNIFNVLFILGLSALVAPLVVDRQLVRQDVPILIAASLLVGGMAFDRDISRGDGAVLVLLLVAYTGLLYWSSRRAAPAELEDPLVVGADSPWLSRLWVQLLLIVAGLALLVLGSRWLVAAAIDMATALGVSPLVIGLTIVSAGTSLPEVATSVVAAARGEREIAVGNVIGSCIFNLLAVLGISALVAPQGLGVPGALLAFDLPVMFAVAVACLPVLFTGHRIGRAEGALFLAYYVFYVTYLVLFARDHAALDEFSLVMSVVVIPLTVFTLVVVAWRELRPRHRA
ncbi:calcium/sodium antiporter [Arenimonas caeni]|jgi:cation:H+ antiporter|uniref:Sodium:calcium antiporter n=1 Tax=Arenimonas caeni TaxID=2058085 RepID=A0A2P6MCK7_9GAMM|nr:calcium/sodium antiporter [Arenimonas caeni]MDY0022918.1 calcium/sodium antiporter [Arenimonas caeni]PRH83717.1 sodium:calcium antiporter [Arenimonas caeni]